MHFCHVRSEGLYFDPQCGHVRTGCDLFHLDLEAGDAVGEGMEGKRLRYQDLVSE